MAGAFRIGLNSRLRFGQAVEVDSVSFWDTLVIPAVPENDDDTVYTVQGEDRIDLLANRFYGDPTLWWVIAVANDLELLPVDLQVGMALRIPAVGGLGAYFAQAENR